MKNKIVIAGVGTALSLLVVAAYQIGYQVRDREIKGVTKTLAILKYLIGNDWLTINKEKKRTV